MVTRTVGILGLTMLMAGACDPEDAADEAITERGLVDNGIRLNGIRLNGIRLNGMRLNGIRLNGDAGTTDYVEIKQIDLKGNDKGSETWLAGSQLSVKGKKGVVSTGVALKEAHIEYELQEGNKGKKNRSIKIVDVSPLAPGSDIMLYQLEVKDSGWQPLCEDGTEAILLGDVWDPTTGDRLAAVDGALTFACRGTALAKCVEFGYRPWASAGGVSLRDHHQACTRMVRADYCGDGQTHTTNGTPIHVLDKLGVQKVDPNVSYVVEAEWGPDGATCLNAANTRHADQVIECNIPKCGASFASGGLVQSGKISGT